MYDMIFFMEYLSKKCTRKRYGDDTKGIIKSRKSKRDRQYNDQKKNDEQ
jgi:hypothetical protein